MSKCIDIFVNLQTTLLLGSFSVEMHTRNVLHMTARNIYNQAHSEDLLGSSFLFSYFNP